ncbi:elongation factor P maturation arginine rhamnosyltransferase EarP [Neisseriaceae bacterium TC5R-5]|nr:elongation factor P maturation arginine rhamnosyltransferase EarP [Neisseriaceae bacterium TC5R-5]
MLTSTHPPQRWDIFCRVIDNFGDIGVAWRLARRLAHDFGLTVHLWVDDLVSFARIAPTLDPALQQQWLSGISIQHWPDSNFPVDVQPAEVVIEAFGCRLPSSFEQAMAAQTKAPVWINLEYLSAETWIEDCHGLPSPHPRLALNKYFFFPGFTPQSGGLLCESYLLEQRQQWQQDSAAQAAFWQRYALPARQSNELRISLFAYENQAVSSLLSSWAGSKRPISCLLPMGKVVADVEAVLGQTLVVGEPQQLGQLRIHLLPMVDQDSYDRLLWSCDLNFVRGEDSLVRAQWAARPLIWQIYPQDEGTHLIKLQAFLARYCANLSPATHVAIQQATLHWNQGTDMGEIWPALENHLASWQLHSQQWPQQLLQSGDLANRLLCFVDKIRQ